jgi:uncharacterized membrane protein YfcA
MAFFVYLIVGCLGGLIGGLLGTGGCVIMMPVVRFGFHFPPPAAIGTTLAAVVFTAASGAIQHIKLKNVDKRTAIIVGCSGVLGVIIGSLIFGYIKSYGKLIDFILGWAFLIVSLRMLYEGLFAKTVSPQQIGSIPGRTIWKSFLGSIIGILTGIIGLGGGYALVPSFIYFLNAPVKLAIGTSMASFVWIAFVGAIFKFFQGVVNIPAASALGIGAIGGCYFRGEVDGEI